MAKTVAQINRELAAIQEQSQDVGQELKTLYGSYLDELSQVAYQQLISICYELCTQFYPDLFLKLSFRDRDQLQRKIKQQGKALKERLHLEQLFQPDESELEALEAALIDGLDLVAGEPADGDSQELPTLEIPGLESPPPSEVGDSAASVDLHAPDLNLSGLTLSDASEAASAAPSESAASESVESEPGQASTDSSSEVRAEPAALDSFVEGAAAEEKEATSAEVPQPEDEDSPRQLPITLIQSEGTTLSPGMLASAIAAEAEDDAADRPSPLPAAIASVSASELELPDTPREMILWQERLERTISQRLRQSSQRMTRLLEKSGVLNNQLPDGLLAPSSDKSDGDSEEREAESGPTRPEPGSNKSPHILTLMLEPAGSKKKKSKGEPIQIVAIYLRLSEIEFSTPMVMGWRNRIRAKLKMLKQLAKQSEQLERKRAIAEAEDAWRSTWSNE